MYIHCKAAWGSKKNVWKMSFSARSMRSRVASKLNLQLCNIWKRIKIMLMWETPICVRSHIVGFGVFFACCFVIYIFLLTLIRVKPNSISFWYLCLPVLVVADDFQNCVTMCIKLGYWDLSRVILPFCLLFHSGVLTLQVLTL